MNLLRAGLATAGGALLLGLAAPAQAQGGGSSILVACAIHYGDSADYTNVTPVAEVGVPYNPFSYSTLHVAWSIVSGNLRPNRYKAACAHGRDIAEIRKKLIQFENNSGYGQRPWRELAFNQTWPSVLDQLHMMSGMRPPPRASFTATAMGSVVSTADNQGLKEREARRKAADAARKPPQQLEIGIGSTTTNQPATPSPAEERYQRDLAAYNEALAARKKAEEAHARALAEEEAKARGNAERAAAAKSAHDAEIARAEQAKAEYESRRAAYRAEYRRLTGRDPED